MKRLVLLLVLAGGVYWYFTRGGGAESRKTGARPVAGDSSGDAFDCLRQAESANTKVHDALMTAARPPVDPAAWSEAESAALSAISAAESSCGGGGTESEQAAQEEIRTALSMLRGLVSDFSAALRGGGGGLSDAPNRQAGIDAHLDRARGLLRR